MADDKPAIIEVFGNRKGIFCVFLSIFTFLTYGEEADVCNNSENIEELVIYPKYTPGFWITVSPNGKYMAYMARSGNYLIRIEPEGKIDQFKVPGLVDFQMSADGKWGTVVNKWKNPKKIHPNNKGDKKRQKKVFSLLQRPAWI